MALMPTGYLDAVVSLGRMVDDAEFRHIGTGFLYRYPLFKEEAQIYFQVLLVTNSHVVSGGVSHVRFNRPADGNVAVHAIETLVQDKKDWAFHPTADVAARPLNNLKGPLIEGRKGDDVEYFDGDIGIPTAEEMKHIVEGNAVFVIGFPMNLVGKVRNYPVVRHGIIARIQDFLRGHEPTFLIDSTVFPGSSGSPVVVKPELTAISKTTATTQAFLIGVVSSYIPYEDVAVSKQTKQPRVIFQENSGLSEVVHIRAVGEIMEGSMIRFPNGEHRFMWNPLPKP